MADLERYEVGNIITVADMASAPEGSWVVRESMFFLRAKSGHSIVSLTPIEDATPVFANKTPEKFTLVYAGPFNTEKTTAVAAALNAL
jgi:hypothetical protein